MVNLIGIEINKKKHICASTLVNETTWSHTWLIHTFIYCVEFVLCVSIEFDQNWRSMAPPTLLHHLKFSVHNNNHVHNYKRHLNSVFYFEFYFQQECHRYAFRKHQYFNHNNNININTKYDPINWHFLWFNLKWQRHQNSLNCTGTSIKLVCVCECDMI